jgi:hypothetical protein
MSAMRLPVVGFLALVIGGAAHAGELERLRDENARLRARIETLEAENARLKGAADAAPLAAALSADAAAAVTSEVAEDGTTRIATEPSRLEASAGPRSRHWIVLRTAPASLIELVVESSSSGRSYRGATALELGVDGARESLAVTRYASEDKTPMRGGIPTVGETVVVGVPPATLGRMATAKSIDGSLGTLRFRLTPQQLATVRAFAERAQRR